MFRHTLPHCLNQVAGRQNWKPGPVWTGLDRLDSLDRLETWGNLRAEESVNHFLYVGPGGYKTQIFFQCCSTSYQDIQNGYVGRHVQNSTPHPSSSHVLSAAKRRGEEAVRVKLGRARGQGKEDSPRVCRLKARNKPGKKKHLGDACGAKDDDNRADSHSPLSKTQNPRSTQHQMAPRKVAALD